jgi:hypothetical protein
MLLDGSPITQVTDIDCDLELSFKVGARFVMVGRRAVAVLSNHFSSVKGELEKRTSTALS